MLLRTKPVSQVAQHKSFSLYEEDIQGLPGVELNRNVEDGEADVWLAVKRLHQTKPPQPTDKTFAVWLDLSQSPDVRPKLRDSVDGATLIGTGLYRSSLRQPKTSLERSIPAVRPDELVLLTHYPHEAKVRALHKAYLEALWEPWANDEKRRRATIKMYGELFTLKQQLEGSIVEAQLEAVWGVGIAVWDTEHGALSYPLITRGVELSLDADTQDILVRPRDADPRLEVDWFAAIDNPGLAQVEKGAKDFFGTATVTFSPFDRGTYEPLLRSAVTHLDPKGLYWPTKVPAQDRSVPKAEATLKVTDSWVLFARPRTSSVFLQDLENLRRQVEEKARPEDLAGAVASLVTEPSAQSVEVSLPSFRGVSATYTGHGGDAGTGSPQDLYFPKPFNDEQVRIVQLLEVSYGVTVQGPPGTGKTHTIANVICHYLASGKRVLVTSMKDPALRVLQEQLPDEIQPLAISLLTSEQEGMKQFEYAIQKIASEVQSLNVAATKREIAILEDSIDTLHGKLARIERDVSRWAVANLTPVKLTGEEIDPQDAAREVVAGEGQYEWIQDRIGVEPQFDPKFGDEDVVHLRKARRQLGNDIRYVGCLLPQIADFPTVKQLLEVHQALRQYAALSRALEEGKVPPLSSASQTTLGEAQSLLEKTEKLTRIRQQVIESARPWTVAMIGRLRASSQADVLAEFEKLGTELGRADEDRKQFLQTPVTIPVEMESDAESEKAISNLSQGRSAFGWKGLFGMSEQKRYLEQATVLGTLPANTQDWQLVAKFLAVRKQLRQLATRWNALASELSLGTVVDTSPEGGSAALQHFNHYVALKVLVEEERNVSKAAAALFPAWLQAPNAGANQNTLAELDTALRHHLTKSRLANVWATRDQFQRTLDGRSGLVVEAIREFLANTLGSPSKSDEEMQAGWSELMAELVRVQRLSPELEAVTRITALVDESGAPQLAQRLRDPLRDAVDSLLPDNWKRAWRLRRLAEHLKAVDAQDELRRLAKERSGLEADLARAYQGVVVKRTWLQLATKASPSIRAALQAYLNAIQKIGKGTGKRAVRYRQDARAAARAANPAVPCWIMPHYRVSESLPADLACFDLVVIDEASQSDLTALPALLRAEKVLVVGDDKQVSPEGVGLEEEKVRSLMARFLGDQVETFRPQMSPERSIYDLYRVVFAKSSVMLREHFRCAPPIIEFSKRWFYNHDLRPLRLPRASERLDPPLIDVFIEDGYRDGNINKAEARYIVEEISKLVADPKMSGRSIGVVSLLGQEQALETWQRLNDALGPEVLGRHKVTCGDARTFQGKERDVMFLSMVHAANVRGSALSRDTFEQRFNVAASRARDRMYLVRSIEAAQLSEADTLRRRLLDHFVNPFGQDMARVEDLRKLCESPFERDVYDELCARGFKVIPQVRVGAYRIDMVVEGHNDARLAIECDGDRYHGPDRWSDDMQRQRILERAGWVFWRCFASTFVRRRKDMVANLLLTLAQAGIHPVGGEGSPPSVHTEQRIVGAQRG